MDWSRVRREQLVRTHGFESIGNLGPPRPREYQAGKKRKHKRLIRESQAASAPGSPSRCTCQKPEGFKGQHKKSCPLRQERSLGPTEPQVRASRPKLVHPPSVSIRDEQKISTARPSVLVAGRDKMLIRQAEAERALQRGLSTQRLLVSIGDYEIRVVRSATPLVYRNSVPVPKAEAEWVLREVAEDLLRLVKFAVDGGDASHRGISGEQKP